MVDCADQELNHLVRELARIAWTPEWEVEEFLRNLEQRGLGALEPESQNEVKDSFDLAYHRLSRRQAALTGLWWGFIREG